MTKGCCFCCKEKDHKTLEQKMCSNFYSKESLNTKFKLKLRRQENVVFHQFYCF